MHISDGGSVCCGAAQALLCDSGILMGSSELPSFFSFPRLQSRWWPKAGGLSSWKARKTQELCLWQKISTPRKMPAHPWSQQCKTGQWEDMFPNSRSDSAFKTICWWTGSSAQQPNVTDFLTFSSLNKTQLLLTRDSCNVDHVWLTSGQIGGEQ